MLTGGEALEDYAEHRAKTELTALLDHAPKLAHILKKKEILDVPVAQVRAGDLLIIRPGEVVPVDAKIVEGSSSFDESSLTGESLPQSKSLNEQILSGSIAIDGVVTAKALRPASESQYEQIIKLVRAAGQSQTPFVRLADRYSIPFTLVSFTIAIVAWVVSGHAIRFLDVLVVATPCPLILAAPIAVISGMSLAAKKGIIIKNGASLERLAEAKTFAFDKTGTLTKGVLVVDKITTYNKFKKSEVIAYAATLEQNSNHVLALAVTKAAIKEKIKLQKAKHISEIAGGGVKAMVKGQQVIIGRLSLLEAEGVSIPSGSIKQVDQTATYVTVGGQLAGQITFRDELREESKNTLKSLRERGIKHILMVTGDSPAVAKAIAKLLNIQEVKAEALPADKLLEIESVKDRPVIFVGDGVNDAPVLTAADVGIALGARGETAASESADMVIMQDDVSKVAEAYNIARRTFSIAKQSILIGIGLSVVLMAIFSSGHFKPVYGAIIQEGVDVIVIFNALRAHSDGRTRKTGNKVVKATAAQ
jgi:heavy metal translocating P-type ATPase